MKEKLVYWPVQFSGTVPADMGTTIIAVPCGMSFRWGAVHVPTDCGGTITVESVNTGQGTASLPIKTQTTAGGGSAWFGSAATNAGTVGTVLNDLYIPAGGTILIKGSAGTSAGTATQLSGVVAFALAEI